MTEKKTSHKDKDSDKGKDLSESARGTRTGASPKKSVAKTALASRSRALKGSMKDALPNARKKKEALQANKNKDKGKGDKGIDKISGKGLTAASMLLRKGHASSSSSPSSSSSSSSPLLSDAFLRGKQEDSKTANLLVSPRIASRAASSKRRTPKEGYWQGQMLLASPAIGDTRFERSVIYLCHQGDDGALGLVVNKVAKKIQFTDVLDHLSIPFSSNFEQTSVHVGGPVESSRGFVLHSSEKMFAGTIELGDLAMTASADILKQIADGKGPKEYVFLLGYAGWGTGQLDKEIQCNAWLHLPFERELVFGDGNPDKWGRAMQKLGVSPHLLSGASGNA